MLRYFTPDYITERVLNIDPDELVRHGIRALILDIDNTLVPYTAPDPTDDITRWLGAVTARGIQCAFISNNDRPRVERFNRSFGFYAQARSGKPSTRAIKSAIEHMNIDPSCVVLIGDQIFTDVLAAKRAGIRVILVTPIELREDLFFKLKRVGEIPFRRRYFRKLKKTESENRGDDER